MQKPRQAGAGAAVVLPLFALVGCSTQQGTSSGSLVLSQYESAGCADVTQTFLQTYTGTFVDNVDLDDQTTAVTIAADGTFELQESRQVGGTGNGVPYPTTCSYFNRGTVLGVFQVASSKGCEALAPAGSGATDILVYQIDEVSVNDAYPSASPATSPGCQTFEGVVGSQASSGNLSYTVDLILMGADSFRFEDSGSGPTAGELLTGSP
jgi:hypothetical protein